MTSGGAAGVKAFQGYRSLPHPFSVSFGKKGSAAPATGVGDVAVHGSLGSEVLKGVLHVPELAVSLFSVPAALASGMAVSFSPAEPPAVSGQVVIARDGHVILTASECNGLFFIDGPCMAAAAALAGPDELSAAVMWHRRLGHLGFSTLADLARSKLIENCQVTADAFLQAGKQQLCEPCITTKLRRTSHPRRAPRPVRVLHRVHADLCELWHGCHFSTVIDEATRYACVTILRSKAATAADMRQQIAWLETQADQRVQRVRHDRGGEYMSHALRRCDRLRKRSAQRHAGVWGHGGRHAA